MDIFARDRYQDDTIALIHLNLEMCSLLDTQLSADSGGDYYLSFRSGNCIHLALLSNFSVECNLCY